MNVIGILATIRDGDGLETFALVNPQKAYYVVPPDACPDDWLALMRQAWGQEGVTPLGVIIEQDESDAQQA